MIECRAIEDYDLLKFAKGGLQPYYRGHNGFQPQMPPEAAEVINEINTIRKEIEENEKRFNYFSGTVISIEERRNLTGMPKVQECPGAEYYSDGSTDWIRESVANQKTNLRMREEYLAKYPDLPSWRNYDEKEDSDHFNYVIGCLVASFFKREDVEAIEASIENCSHGIKHPKERQEHSEPLKESARPENYFIRNNMGWEIGFAGKKGIWKDYKYIKYLAYILRCQGKSIKCTEIVRAVNYVGGEFMSAKEAAAQDLQHSKITKDPEISFRLSKELEMLLAEQESETDPLIRKENENTIATINKKISHMNLNKVGKYLDDPESKNAQDTVSKGLKSAYAAFRKYGMKNLAIHLEEEIEPDGNYDYRNKDTETIWEIKL